MGEALPSVVTSAEEALILPSLTAPEQLAIRRLASVTLCISTLPPAAACMIDHMLFEAISSAHNAVML